MNSNTSDNHIILRKGVYDDLPAMLQLFTATIDEVCKKDYDLQQLEAWKSGAENEERWMKVIKDQYVVVAVTETKIAGFCTLDQGNYIDLLFVHKDCQHRGIATLLYRHIEKEALLNNEKKLQLMSVKRPDLFLKKEVFMWFRNRLFM
ncbi:GNAT family N-acetyltransferase [Chryseobacterium sp. PCH239]|nr:GNAT family N-acetyltransferase [Chryseobacterium sp. PCH239]QWT85632.1 GNAT family N-acetyltransferase [Chryseobacterium sp. PCH239]